MAYFGEQWKPQAWDRKFCFLFIRTRACRQNREPIQLDLFVPHVYGYDFKVIVTNKTLEAGRVVAFHEGRGCQENTLGELKRDCQRDYVPVRTRCGNQLYLLAALFAHNLPRELQMATTPPCRNTTTNRAPLWAFEKPVTLRINLLNRAGRFTRPQGILTLTLNANARVRERLLGLLQALRGLKSAA